jgi:thioredoxin reductase (NADPH)
MKTYDVIIIGAGPAGLTSALYSARYKLNTLIISSNIGGYMGETNKIWNFPSYNEISGIELTTKMYNQVKSLNVEIKNELVSNIEKKKNLFEIITNKDKYVCKKVIITIGREKAKLNLKNEDKFLGKGVHYCATCDSSFYKDKIVAVIGGGNSAMSASLLLTEYAKKVYIIYRRADFKNAEKMLVEQVIKNKKIETIFNANVTELIGKDNLEAIKLSDNKKIELNGIFIEVGSLPNKSILKNLNLNYEKDFIKVNNKQETNIKGVFAAGDITNNILKQIITASAEGAISAYSAYLEVQQDL